MKPAALLSTVILLWACLAGVAAAQDFTRAAGETDETFAQRVFRLPDASEPHITAASWNGSQVLFVDYMTAEEYPERPLVALQRQRSGAWRRIEVTLGEHEGATPDIAAIGFANADRDLASELIVILTWSTQHYDVGGTLYEVRILDDAKPGEATLTQLKVSARLGSACDCEWRDGTRKHFRFKTIAAVKKELKRLGY